MRISEDIDAMGCSYESRRFSLVTDSHDASAKQTLFSLRLGHNRQQVLPFLRCHSLTS